LQSAAGLAPEAELRVRSAISVDSGICRLLEVSRFRVRALFSYV
jgi:hypothetical protein